MKTKDKKELLTRSVSELKKLLEEARKAIVSLKLDHQQNKLKDTRSIFNKRKEIAVLQSIINLKKIVEGEVKEAVKKVTKGGSK